MADDEDHRYGPVSSSKPAVAAATKPETPWNQSLARWCLTSDRASGQEAGSSGDEVGQKAIGYEEDVKSARRHPADDGEDESGLELCLGLSLGGSISKVKPSKNGLKEGGGNHQGVGEKVKEEDCPRNSFPKDREGPTRRVDEGRVFRAQDFWDGFLASRESLKKENASPLDSDAVHELLAQSNHLGSSTGGRLSMHVDLPETWNSMKNSTGEGSKVASAHQFWQVAQENASQADKNDEKPILKDLLRVPTTKGSASGWGRVGLQGGGAMQLFDRFKDNGEGDPRSIVSSVVKKSSSVSYSVQVNGSKIQAGGNVVLNEVSGDGCPGPPNNKECTSLAKGEVSSQEENTKAAAEQQQRHMQDAMEQQKKHKRQEARKKRKAALEEQKLQKKSKKDDECRLVSAQAVKQQHLTYQGTRPGTPASGSKVSSTTGPLPGTSREVSIGTREVSSPPDSQDGESTNSGFRRTGSGAMWQQGSVWEGPSASAVPDKPPDNPGNFNENDDGNQLREIRRALQRERDRAAKDKERELGMEARAPGDRERRISVDIAHPQTDRGEEPSKLHLPGGDITSHEPSSIVSASSVNRLELKSVQADSAWVQRMAEMQMNNHPANKLLELKETLFKKVPDLNGIRKTGDVNGNQGRGDLNEIQRKRDHNGIQGRGDLNGIQGRGPPPASSSMNSERAEAAGQGAVQHAELNDERIRLEYREAEVSGTIAGGKSNENPTKRSTSPFKNMPSIYSGHPPSKVLSLSSARVQGGVFTHLQSPPSVRILPPYGPLQTWSDSFQSGNVNSSSAITTLVAALEAPRGQPGAVASTSDRRDRCPPGSGRSPSVQVDTHEEMSGREGQQGGSCGTESTSRISNSNAEEGKGVQVNRFQQGTTQRIPTTEGLVVHFGQEASNLKLGVAAGQIFGGSGSSPDLPWVTCTGSGSNGRSICGVLYRYKKGQVRIVCACHGGHMSPSEFVQHAGNVDLANPEKSIVVGSFTPGSGTAPVKN